VKVTEVVAGSAAASLGVEVGVAVLALNGSDVTGHGKVSLSKMIGYLPRPLVMTLSLPAAEDPGTPEVGGPSVQTSTAPKEKSRPALKKKLKSARKKNSPKNERRGGHIFQASGEFDSGDGTEEAARMLAGAAPEGAAPVTTDGHESSNAAATESGKAEAAAHRENRDKEVIEEDAKEGDDGVAVSAIDDEAAMNTSSNEAADEETLPTGASRSSSSWAAVRAAARNAPVPDEPTAPAAPSKPNVPQRAHPPPSAPVEAFPPWATVPPVRKPRHVSGMDAKYVLKSTLEAFQHESLAMYHAEVEQYGKPPAAADVM